MRPDPISDARDWNSPQMRFLRADERSWAHKRQAWRRRLADVSQAVGTASVTGMSPHYELAGITERRNARKDWAWSALASREAQ